MVRRAIGSAVGQLRAVIIFAALAYPPAVSAQDNSVDDAMQKVNREHAVALVPRPIVHDASDTKIKLAAVGQPMGAARSAQSRRLEENRFVTEVPNVQRFEQTGENRCWAACVEMLLKSDAIEREQADLVADFRPNAAREAANLGVLVRALCPELEPRLKGKIVLPVQLFPSSTDVMLAELAAGYPVIVGLKDPNAEIGHMCVAVSATYAQRESGGAPTLLGALPLNAVGQSVGQYALHSIDVIDPAPGQTKLRTITAADLKVQLDFMMSRRTARQMMENSLELLSTDGDPRSNRDDDRDRSNNRNRTARNKPNQPRNARQVAGENDAVQASEKAFGRGNSKQADQSQTRAEANEQRRKATEQRVEAKAEQKRLQKEEEQRRKAEKKAEREEKRGEKGAKKRKK